MVCTNWERRLEHAELVKELPSSDREAGLGKDTVFCADLFKFFLPSSVSSMFKWVWSLCCLADSLLHRRNGQLLRCTQNGPK